jgi:hypothetical protein
MRTSTALLVALFAPALAGQTVWPVPDGQPVDPFIAAAAPGDILLLASSHPPFDLDKGLTIFGLGTGVTGTQIGGFQSMNFNVPAGQRATLANCSLALYSWTGTVPTGLIVNGRVAIANVTSASLIAVNGESIIERVSVASGGLIVGGICSVTDSVLRGSDLRHAFFWIGPTPGLIASGIVVASNVTVIGGSGGTTSSGSMDSAAAVEVSSGGTLWLTDSTINGGAGGPSHAGGVALASAAATSIARTSLIDGAGAMRPSYGYQHVPAMVGMHCAAPPTRGSLFQAEAIAGNSQGPLVIVAGLDRTANAYSSPFAEPLFGFPGQYVTLALAVPAPATRVPVNVLVPNIAASLGIEVWVQAVQISGSEIRASALVGGAIR